MDNGSASQQVTCLNISLIFNHFEKFDWFGLELHLSVNEDVKLITFIFHSNNLNILFRAKSV